MLMTLFFIFLLVLGNDWTRYEIEGKTYYQVRTPFGGDSCRQLEQAYLIFARPRAHRPALHSRSAYPC